MQLAEQQSAPSVDHDHSSLRGGSVITESPNVIDHTEVAKVSHHSRSVICTSKVNRQLTNDHVMSHKQACRFGTENWNQDDSEYVHQPWKKGFLDYGRLKVRLLGEIHGGNVIRLDSLQLWTVGVFKMFWSVWSVLIRTGNVERSS